MNGGETQVNPPVWYQNLSGADKDPAPVTDAAHGRVYKDGDRYTNTAPVVKYTVTVTDATASIDGTPVAEAEEGAVITVTADTAPEGKVFDKWEIVSGEITLTDESAATTSFTMPAGNVSLRATYKDVQITPPAPVKYGVTVTDGSASIDGTAVAEAEEGTVITVTADTAPKGKEFDKWEIVSGEITLADESAATTSFTMPAGNVSIRATYKDVQITPPAPVKYGITVTDGSASIDGTPVAEAEEGTVITVTADTAPEGKVFDKWEITSANVTLADENAATTTFTMPAEAVSLKATYKTVTSENPTGPTGTDVTGETIVEDGENLVVVETATPLAPCEINKGIKLPDKIYNGKPQTQKFKVVKDGKTLKEGTDYKLVYTDNVHAGTACVSVIGAGAYTGSVPVFFNIQGKPLNKLKVVADKVAVGGDYDTPIHVYDGVRELIKGEDYDYELNTADLVKGTNQITIEAVENSDYVEGSKPLVAKVTAVELAEGQKLIDGDCVTLSGGEGFEMTPDGLAATYDGTAKIPEVTVEVDGEVLKVGTDYTVSVKNNKTAGTAIVTVKGKGKVYTGQATAAFVILPSAEKFTTVTVNKNKDLIYNGKLQTPAVEVKAMVGGKEKKLAKNKDYILSYRCNINQGTAYVTVTGIGNYEGVERDYIFNIKPQSIAKASKKIKNSSDITLKYGGKVLKEGFDYKLTVTDSAAAGKRKVVIEGIGNYEGTFVKDKVKPGAE